VCVARVGAYDHDDVSVLDRLEGLCARRGAEGLAHAVARGRMAHACAGVHVVGVQRGAHQFLRQVHLFIRAAARGDAAHRVLAVARLDGLEARGGEVDRLVPAHLAPRVGDFFAHHGRLDAVRVRGVAPGKAALDAGMALVGLAVLPRHHAHHGVAFHLGLEAAAHAAIGAGGDHAVLGLAEFDHGLFLQGRGRASLHAGTAAHAFAVHEGLLLARRHARRESAACNRQRERALHLLAGAHAAVADDAFGRVVREVGVGLILLRAGVVRPGDAVHALACDAVAHVAQARHTGHVLQLAIAVGAAGQAVQRVVADVELHHALAQLLQPRRLRVHHHAGLDRRGARGRETPAALDFHQTQAARAERLQAVGGAKFGHVDARVHGSAQQRGALGHGDAVAVYGQGDGLHGAARGSAVVDLGREVGQHRRSPSVVGLRRQCLVLRRGRSPGGSARAPRARGRASCRPSRTNSSGAWCRTDRAAAGLAAAGVHRAAPGL